MTEHEFIIKMPDAPPDPEYGIGYEIFHKMKMNQKEIAQYWVETDESLTVGELLNDSIKVSINLKKMDLSDEDIVGVCSWSNKQSCVPYIAGLFNGNIVTFVDPLVVPKEKALMFRKVTPKVLFVDEKNLESVENALEMGELSMKIVVFGDNSRGHISYKEFLIASEEEINSFEPVEWKNNERTCSIVFSSGTSNVPKGICLSHLAVLARTSGFTTPVTFICTTPNWISYSTNLIRCFREGDAMVPCNNYDATQIWGLIAKYKVTLLIATVYQLSQMIEHPPTQDDDISFLTLIVVSGATLPRETFAKFKSVIPQPTILQCYGLSEAGGILLVYDLSLAEHREWYKSKPESCGTPIPGIWYKVVNPETEEILGPNEPGELRVKSKITMNGYYNEDSSKDYDSEGYLKTGDIVRYDEDRCFYFVERIKELLKFRGIYISPTNLENILTTHPAVELSAIIGLPHIADGDVPLGIVKLRQNCKVTPEELVKYVDENVADKRHRLYAGVKIVKDFPLTGSGKLHKRQIRDMVISNKIQ